MSPINHATTTAIIGGTQWNEDHTAPTLAEVLPIGNDVDGNDIVSAAGAVGDGAFVRLSAANVTPDYAGGVVLNAGNAAAGKVGGYVALNSGQGDNGGLVNASVVVYGGGNDPGVDGRIAVLTGNSWGAQGEVLVAQGDANTTVLWASLFSTNAGAPGATFVTVLRLDTTNKHLYVWNGSAYVKVSDYV
jgi:hypothetical protein